MSYKHFQNTECEFYPCHETEELNCLFCFCPLYDTDCGGDFVMIDGKNGEKIKDCSNCNLPHGKDGYDYVINRLKER